MYPSFRNLPRSLRFATIAGLGGGTYYLFVSPNAPDPRDVTRRYKVPLPWTPPPREGLLKKLRRSGNGDPQEEFDLLVIGGGATGAGVALDAVTRGLKVALVERNDFSSGTSSKSTKLVHGGVRYLQKAIMKLDYEQYKLVREALHERKVFLHTAPHLSVMQPIMLPVYKWWQLPYYYAGCKMYDLLAGHQNISSSYLISRSKALEAFPMLKSAGLVGAVVYYDGMHNDARMNLALILTAIKHGAVATNYTEVTSLHKDAAGKLVGAMVKDTTTGSEFPVRAKGIINATGPFTDALLSLDNPSHEPIVQASSGVHVTFPDYYSPRNMGLLDPTTSDGRVIFFLPWQGNTIAGTTDTKARVETDPKPHEEDIRWILEEVKRYLSPDIQVRRGDVLSAWSGLRPLVLNPNAQKGGTEGLVRNHLITVSQSGLVTIAGGKWTTYRAMAEETVDRAVDLLRLKTTGPCRTKEIQLVGSEGWAKNMFIGLIQRYGLEAEVAQHLSDNYGDRAWTVCEYMEPTGERWPLYGKRLNLIYPFLDAEVRYTVHNEYAVTAVDFLARRSRLTFLNAQIALDVLPKVVEIMAQELQWSAKRQRQEIIDTERFMESMGVPLGSRPSLADQAAVSNKWAWNKWAGGWSSADPFKTAVRRVQLSRAHFEPGEVELLKAAWASNAGDERKINRESARGVVLEKLDVPGLTGSEVDEVVANVVKDREGVDQEEFLRVCATLKDLAAAPPLSKKSRRPERRVIPVEKSGGGV